MKKVIEKPFNTQKIAKNALFLYIRMLFILACNLVVVRVVLNALGAEDYGINNVVGGVVAMFGFLTSTMNAASQRFFSFELGRNNQEGLSNYFTITTWTYVGISLLVIIVAETFGLWFLQNKLTIPPNRASAALWVYQGTIISFVISLLAIPYNSVVIARERMSIYAYVGIIEVSLRLLVAYVLFAFSGDRLKLYAVLLCIAMSIPSAFYIIWGTTAFKECKLKKYWNTTIFKEMFSFSCWNLFGALASILRSQGINILLNIFFNPIVNAARAIAYQINSAMNQFVLNFFKAVQPQIIKLYAANEKAKMLNLIFTSTKFSFFLVILIATPLFLEAPFILSLWLKVVPQHTILFTRMVILISVIESISYPLQTSLMATGKIKFYQITTGSISFLNIPISYFFLNNNYPPETTLYIAIILAIVSQISRIAFMKKQISMGILNYITKSILPCLAVFLPSFIISFYISKIQLSDNITFILTTCSSLIITFIFVYLVGLSKTERQFLLGFIKRKL